MSGTLESGPSLNQEQSGESVGLRFWQGTDDRILTFITSFTSPCALLPDEMVESPRAEVTGLSNFDVAVPERTSVTRGPEGFDFLK